MSQPKADAKTSKRSDAASSVSEAGQWAVIAIVGGLLFMSNPNEQQFAGFARSQQGFFEKLACQPHQTSNYLIFSRYEINCNDYQRTEYLGVLGTFHFMGVREGWE